jgi:membrane protein YqaA with SNARE-associated domain
VKEVDPAVASLLLGLVAAGLVSGLLPFVNAEAILTVAVIGQSHLWLAIAISITVGQVIAKVVIFVGSREGTARARRRQPRPVRKVRSRALARVTTARVAQLLATLERPLAGAALVAVSAVVGVPPLAATSVLAGAARMRISLFCSTCLVGRLIRFGLVAYPLSQLAQP